MLINGEKKHTIWTEENHPEVVFTFDQRTFPHEINVAVLQDLADVKQAIKKMVVRGAPLIGVTAAYGLYLASLRYTGNELYAYLQQAADELKQTRPTAVNLQWAVNEQLKIVAAHSGLSHLDMAEQLLHSAERLKAQDIAQCSAIGDYGLSLIKEFSQFNGGKEVNILTHCNAGWLACIDWGTATAPIYKAYEAGIPVHVWVDETRPRLQGAKLTAFELAEHGIPHTIITDNAGGHLMQHGEVDMVIVGADRVTRNGDVANKIGTYLKALAANDNHIPFYVTFPSSTIDWELDDGIRQIPIEIRSEREIHELSGVKSDGQIDSVRVSAMKSSALNHGFDVTPSRLVSAFITERGICQASEDGLLNIYPELQANGVY